MAEIVQSLFGVSPEMYQQRQEDQASARALQFARLTPFQQANYAIGRGAYGLAGALGGALGGQDPELQRVTTRQQIAGQIDYNNPESIKQGIAALSQAGDSQGAMQLQQIFLSQEKTRAETTKALRERAGADPIQQIIRSGKYTPASVSAYQESGDVGKLELMEKPKKDTSEQLIISGKYTPASVAKYQISNNIEDLVLVQKKSIGQEIGEGLQGGFGLLGKALAPALKKEGEETGKFSAKNYDELGGAVAAGISSKRNLDTLNSALKNAFTGTLSDTKTSIVKALDGIGLPVGDDLKKAASSTELLNAMSTRYVFPLVKNFPGSLAAKELDRLEKTAPTALQQPETITRLVNLLRTDISENEYTYNKAKEYRSQNKSLIGFNQADQKIDFQNKFNRMQTLYDKFTKQSGGSVAEKAEFDSLKRELGVK